MSESKVYISAQQLMEDSLELGRQVLESGFRPNFIVGVWRGGTPVGIAVQELLDFYGVETDHISIRTSSYNGMVRNDSSAVRVHGLSYLTRSMNAEDSLLIVDDVFDTGLSVKAIIEYLKKRARKNTPTDIRVATAYFKPAKNLAGFEPDYTVHINNNWLVFPHEMEGLSMEEIKQNKPDLYNTMNRIKSLKPAKLA